MSEPQYRLVRVGDPAPWFRQRSTGNADYAFDTSAGRYLVLCLFGSAAHAEAARRLAVAHDHRALFDDDRIAFFGVSVDPQDEAAARVAMSLPGIRHFWDFDGRVSRLYGALPAEPSAQDGEAFRAAWVILNPNLRVRAVLPFARDGADIDQVVALLRALPPVDRFAGFEMHAPVILIPDIFEPDFCATLLQAYERHGGQVSGFMRDVGGRTVGVHDPRHKVRSDHLIEDEALQLQIRQRVIRRVASAIRQASNFEVTRMERYLVACYDSRDGGHFRAHRDNTTRGTAHRRFALSVNLNDDFDGGGIAFPEFGSRTYKPAPGAGVVFGCSLLHAVTPVTRGRRFAFLPFLYDDAAAALRERNRRFLQDGAAPRDGG